MIIRNATSVRKILRNGQFIYNVIRNSKLYYYYISESFIELEYHYGINDEIIYPSDTLEVKDGKIISFKVPVRRLIDGIVGQYDTINQRVTYNEPQKNSAKPLRGGPIKTLKYHRLDLDNNQYTFIRDTSSVFHRTPYSFIIGNYFLETSQENTGYEFISLKELIIEWRRLYKKYHQKENLEKYKEIEDDNKNKNVELILNEKYVVAEIINIIIIYE